MNHIDLGMPLPQAIAAPRISQRNTAIADAEPGFLALPVATVLQQQYGEGMQALTGPVLPADSLIGNATGITLLPGGRFQAAAEPTRSGGGSALVVDPN